MQDSNFHNRYSNTGFRPQGGGNRNGGNSYNNVPKPTAESEFSKLAFDNKWIQNGADEKLVDYAEKAGKFMANNGLTNSKIRSIYGEIKRIQMGEFEKEKSSFYLLKPKVAYALGRDDKNEGLKLFKKVFDTASSSVSDQKSYQNFCNFIEAILAYHKAFGGKD
jgi:CRISPR-associated protein Csm2